MPIDPRLVALMADTIHVYPSVSVDAYGKRTFGTTPETFKGRAQYKSEVIRDATGKEIVSTGKVYLGGVSTAVIGDRLVLPDGTEPLILSIDVMGDNDGDHHTVLYFGTTR